MCNRYKGSDLGSILVPAGDLIRFFSPRIDVWPDHFSLDGVIIKPLTAIGQVTERIFRFNAIERLMALRYHPDKNQRSVVGAGGFRDGIRA